MRSWVLAVAVLFVVPASASADYRVLDEVFPGEAQIAVAGAEVFAGQTTDEMKGVIAYGLNGGTRTLVRLGRDGFADVAASPQALVAGTSRGPWFGPPAGPLALIPDDVWGIAVTGSTVLTLEGKGRARPSSPAIWPPAPCPGSSCVPATTPRSSTRPARTSASSSTTRPRMRS